jgi:hypothetical protein
MLQAARATQRLWYPEFLPDPARPSGLPGADTPDRTADRPSGLSESFGTLRYGRLAEVLLYDVRRTTALVGVTRQNGHRFTPSGQSWNIKAVSARGRRLSGAV